MEPGTHRAWHAPVPISQTGRSHDPQGTEQSTQKDLSSTVEEQTEHLKSIYRFVFTCFLLHICDNHEIMPETDYGRMRSKWNRA